MLQNKLYSIESIDLEGSKDMIKAQIRLDQEHPIFDGHFPDNPILPGVCTVQIVTELMGSALGKEFMLTKASNIKYLGFISPVLSPVLRFEMILRNLDNGAVACNTSVLAKDQVVCSFKAEYVTFPKFSSHTPR